MPVGVATGIGLALWFVRGPSSPFLLVSLVGSSVFLFGLTRAAAQPRALFDGHLGSALIGVLYFQSFGDELWVYMLAMVLTLIYMLVTKTVHPPAGANPLMMVHEHAGFFSLWHPAGL
jgi:CBS-domain-containing membrane protein